MSEHKIFERIRVEIGDSAPRRAAAVLAIRLEPARARLRAALCRRGCACRHDAVLLCTAEQKQEQPQAESAHGAMKAVAFFFVTSSESETATNREFLIRATDLSRLRTMYYIMISERQ